MLDPRVMRDDMWLTDDNVLLWDNVLGTTLPRSPTLGRGTSYIFKLHDAQCDLDLRLGS